jgi:hypothetical protein
MAARHLKNPETGECEENCFGCKLETVSFAPSAMVTRSPQAVRAAAKDPQLDKDREAYRRLRQNGEQPKHVGGSAYIEASASESCEITTGTIIRNRADRTQFAKAFAEAPTKPLVNTNPDESLRKRITSG